MRRHALGAVLALLVLVLAGCQTKNGGGQGDPFVGGTTSLLMEFEQGAPPEAVFDGGTFPFDIVVKLKNDGEWDIPVGKASISISGINPSEFGVSPSSLVQTVTEQLDATHKDAEGNIIPGGTYFATFSNLNYHGDLVGNRPFPIRADACFGYGTRATSSICVRKSLRDTGEEGVCKVNEDKSTYSSGAPIQVGSFSEAAAGTDKLSFTFTITHKGNGNIYKSESSCDGSVYSNRNKVYVEVNSRLPGLKCRGLMEGDDTHGYVLLSGEGKSIGERAITCTQPVSAQTDYNQIVDITLTYDYKDDISTTLLVKDGGQ